MHTVTVTFYDDTDRETTRAHFTAPSLHEAILEAVCASFPRSFLVTEEGGTGLGPGHWGCSHDRALYWVGRPSDRERLPNPPELLRASVSALLWGRLILKGE